MTNLLEQAINSNDGDHAAKIIQAALGIQSDEVANYCSRKLGRTTESSVHASSVNGCRPRPASWREAAPLPARLVLTCRATRDSLPFSFWMRTSFWLRREYSPSGGLLRRGVGLLLHCYKTRIFCWSSLSSFNNFI
jgi:hypothetical protein